MIPGATRVSIQLSAGTGGPRLLHMHVPTPADAAGAYDCALLIADVVERALIDRVEASLASRFVRFGAAMRRAMGEGTA